MTIADGIDSYPPGAMGPHGFCGSRTDQGRVNIREDQPPALLFLLEMVGKPALAGDLGEGLFAGPG
jgi:hypothetical protein